MATGTLVTGSHAFQRLAKTEMEPTRQLVRAIMSPGREAQRARWTDVSNCGGKR